jgi:hypothetical protein
MKRKLIASICVLAGLSVSLSARANIAVYNNGFENQSGGVANGWNAMNVTGANTTGNSVTDTAGAGFGGSYGEVFVQGAGSKQPGIQIAPADDPVLTTATEYQVSFWAKSTGAGTIMVSLNGEDSGQAGQGASPVLTASGYTEYFVDMAPIHINQPVEINFYWSGAGVMSLDDIGLSAVPEPSTVLAGLLVLVPTGASTLQILRKKRNT